MSHIYNEMQHREYISYTINIIGFHAVFNFQTNFKIVKEAADTSSICSKKTGGDGKMTYVSVNC